MSSSARDRQDACSQTGYRRILRTKVTLLEAGGSDSSIFIKMPAGFLQLMQSGSKDWGYETTPRRHTSGVAESIRRVARFWAGRAP